MQIDEAIEDLEVTGLEVVPASDGGAPKKVQISSIKNYVVAQLLASGDAEPTVEQSAMILSSSGLKFSPLNDIIQLAVNHIWAQIVEADPAGTDIIPLKSGNDTCVVTLAKVSSFVETAVKTSVREIVGLDATDVITDNHVVATQLSGGDVKKVTIGMLKAATLAGFGAWVASATEIDVVSDNDVVFVLQGGNGLSPRKIKMSTLKAVMGNVKVSESTVENMIPQWASGANTLKNGIALVNVVSSAENASDEAVPTEKAVVAFMASKIEVDPLYSTDGMIPVFAASATKLVDGYAVVDVIDEDTADGRVPSVKAVSNAIATAMENVEPGGGGGVSSGNSVIFIPVSRLSATQYDDNVFEEVEVLPENLGADGFFMPVLTLTGWALIFGTFVPPSWWMSGKLRYRVWLFVDPVEIEDDPPYKIEFHALFRSLGKGGVMDDWQEIWEEPNPAEALNVPRATGHMLIVTGWSNEVNTNDLSLPVSPFMVPFVIEHFFNLENFGAPIKIMGVEIELLPEEVEGD